MKKLETDLLNDLRAEYEFENSRRLFLQGMTHSEVEEPPVDKLGEKWLEKYYNTLNRKLNKKRK